MHPPERSAISAELRERQWRRRRRRRPAIPTSARMRSERARDIAGDKNGHQGKKQGSPRQLRGQNGDHWRADHHPERIGADDVSRHRDRHTDIAGDIRQQPHDAELARPDAEATDGQRELREDLAGLSATGSKL
jgi:hypothetical protein